VNRPSAFCTGLDDEHIAGLERHRRLALDLDGAAALEQMARARPIPAVQSVRAAATIDWPSFVLVELQKI
jgi:hypothetical protein